MNSPSIDMNLVLHAVNSVSVRSNILQGKVPDYDKFLLCRHRYRYKIILLKVNISAPMDSGKFIRSLWDGKEHSPFGKIVR